MGVKNPIKVAARLTTLVIKVIKAASFTVLTLPCIKDVCLKNPRKFN